MDAGNIIALDAGSVEYSVDEAAIHIDELIEMLEAAKSEGADRVVFLSGNYRGAKYVSAPRMYDWLDDVNG